MKDSNKRFTLVAIVNTHGYQKRPELYNYHVMWIRNFTIEDKYFKYERAIREKRYSDVPTYLRYFENSKYLRIKVLMRNVPSNKIGVSLIKCQNYLKKKYGEHCLYQIDSR